MNGGAKEKGQLIIALDMLNELQWRDYAKQCDTKNLSTTTRLSITANLFDDRQANLFTKRVAGHEGFANIPKNCPGTDCCGCVNGGVHILRRKRKHVRSMRIIVT